MKAHVQSPLKDFDDHVRAYRNGSLSWGAYVRLLARHTNDFSPKVETFLAALELEEKLNSAQVESERTTLITRLVSKLSKSETEELGPKRNLSRRQLKPRGFLHVREKTLRQEKRGPRSLSGDGLIHSLTFVGQLGCRRDPGRNHGGREKYLFGALAHK